MTRRPIVTSISPSLTACRWWDEPEDRNLTQKEWYDWLFVWLRLVRVGWLIDGLIGYERVANWREPRHSTAANRTKIRTYCSKRSIRQQQEKSEPFSAVHSLILARRSLWAHISRVGHRCKKRVSLLVVAAFTNACVSALICSSLRESQGGLTSPAIDKCVVWRSRSACRWDPSRRCSPALRLSSPHRNWLASLSRREEMVDIKTSVLANNREEAFGLWPQSGLPSPTALFDRCSRLDPTLFLMRWWLRFFPIPNLNPFLKNSKDRNLEKKWTNWVSKWQLVRLQLLHVSFSRLVSFISPPLLPWQLESSFSSFPCFLSFLLLLCASHYLLFLFFFQACVLVHEPKKNFYRTFFLSSLVFSFVQQHLILILFPLLPFRLAFWCMNPRRIFIANFYMSRSLWRVIFLINCMIISTLKLLRTLLPRFRWDLLCFCPLSLRMTRLSFSLSLCVSFPFAFLLSRSSVFSSRLVSSRLASPRLAC